MSERWQLSTKKANSRDEGFKRVRGVEPPSQPWQGCVIAVILHPHFVPGLGIEPSLLLFQSSVRTSYTTPAFPQ